MARLGCRVLPGSLQRRWLFDVLPAQRSKCHVARPIHLMSMVGQRARCLLAALASYKTDEVQAWPAHVQRARGSDACLQCHNWMTGSSIDLGDCKSKGAALACCSWYAGWPELHACSRSARSCRAIIGRLPQCCSGTRRCRREGSMWQPRAM